TPASASTTPSSPATGSTTPTPPRRSSSTARTTPASTGPGSRSPATCSRAAPSCSASGDGQICRTAPGCGGVDLEVSGNTIGTLETDELGVCSSGGTGAAAIAVWGSEATGDPADDNVVSSGSLDGTPGAVITRSDC